MISGLDVIMDSGKFYAMEISYRLLIDYNEFKHARKGRVR